MQSLAGDLSRVRAALEASQPLFWIVLGGLVLGVLWILVRPRTGGRRVAALVTIGFALAWLLVDKRAEGPTLVMFSDEHGITAADLLSVGAILIAGRRLRSR